MENISNSLLKIGIIADDLTGANDTAVQFATLGLSTIVMMSLSGNLSDCPEDVIVVDTNSRADTPELAYRKTADVAAFFPTSVFNILYKKIDSTLRGNLGPEIDAIVDTLGHSLVIVAPSFPKNGRVVIDGHLLMQGVPLEGTEIARDPRCPVTESHIPSLLARQTKRKIGHVGIKAVLGGSSSILHAINALRSDGHEIIVCDVWEDSQFAEITTAASALQTSVLWVGSAGLAAYVLGGHKFVSSQKKQLPVVVLAGSVSNVTRRQVARLKERSEVACIEANPCAFLMSATAESEIQHCFQMASELVNKGKDVVVVAGYDDDIVAKTIAAGAAQGLSKQQTAEAVAQGIGHLCRRLAMDLALSGLVLTGGDTALSCCSALAATGIRIEKEVAPGIPLGTLRGGVSEGMRVVTKAGAFGAENALCLAVDCLKQ